MGIMRTALLWASENQWMRRNVPRRGFVRQALKRFMPGEDVADAVEAAKSFRERDISTIFTHLGENITDLSEAGEAAKHYLVVLDWIAAEKLPTEISLKLTQIGFDLSEEQTYRNFSAIAVRAASMGNTVWIDMEGSAYTQRTIDFYGRARREHSNVGLCLQAYLYRTEQDIADLLPLSPAIRLVKGAYHEPKEVAFEKKSQVDENYLKLSKQLLKASREGRGRTVLGTHDLKIIAELEKFSAREGIDRQRLEFHLLYGIKTAEQRRLARAGYRVGVLISYGEFWYPWYMRRLAERPANVLFVLKNMFSG